MTATSDKGSRVMPLPPPRWRFAWCSSAAPASRCSAWAQFAAKAGKWRGQGRRLWVKRVAIATEEANAEEGLLSAIGVGLGAQYRLHCCLRFAGKKIVDEGFRLVNWICQLPILRKETRGSMVYIYDRKYVGPETQSTQYLHPLYYIVTMYGV